MSFGLLGLDSFCNTFQEVPKNVGPGNDALIVLRPEEDDIIVDDMIVQVLGLDDEVSEDFIEGCFAVSDDDGAVAMMVRVGLVSFHVKVGKERVRFKDEDGICVGIFDNGPSVRMALEFCDEVLPFRGVELGNDGEVEATGELIDGGRVNGASFTGDFTIIEVEEVEGSLAFIGADFRAGFADVFVEDNLNVSLAIEDGTLGADPSIEDEGAALARG